MKNAERTARSARKRLVLPPIALATAGLLAASACGHLAMMGHGSVQKPAADAFGLGPRISELRQLEAFLRSLSGGVSAPARYLRAPQEDRS